MDVIISVSVAIIALCLGWLLFAPPPAALRMPFLGAVISLLACGIYALLFGGS